MARKDDDFPEAASLDWLHGKKDPAHIETDRVIDELTARFQEQYKKAQDDITEKLNKFYEKFAKDDAEMRALLKAGEITKERYAEWRKTKMLTGQRWKDLRDRIAQDYVDANTTARNMILNEMPNVYAINHNYAGYMIERQARIDTSWTLYNRRSVENLVKNDDILLPFPRTESRTAQKLRERMDLIWNRQHLANTMAQGIMQGESIYDIAERLQKITDMNKAVAVRNARTMMTATQNKARNDSFEELREKGVEISEYWLATLDGFTRHSHRMLHGEEKDQETGEYSNGLRYPADPYGKPAEVYNCRCSEIGMPKGFPPDIPKWSSGMGDLSFEEWQDMKTSHDPNYVRKETVQKKVEQVKKPDPKYDEIKSRLEGYNVPRVPFGKNEDSKLEDFEIIEKIAGGDLTKGSCASAAMCYAGNRGGYDVRDFRGGDSRTIISQNTTLNRIAQMEGVNGTYMITNEERKRAKELLSSMESGKEYILGLARHMAVVKLDEDFGIPMYLELQSSNPRRNGWHQLDDAAMTNRFGCPKRKTKYPNSLQFMEVDKLSQAQNFPDLLEFINTNEADQQKGGLGHER